MLLRAYHLYKNDELKGLEDIPRVPLFVNGEFIQSQADEWLPVHNPSTQELISLVPQATSSELAMTIQSSAEAFKSWKLTSVVLRQQKMFELQKLIKLHMVFSLFI